MPIRGVIEGLLLLLAQFLKFRREERGSAVIPFHHVGTWRRVLDESAIDRGTVFLREPEYPYFRTRGPACRLQVESACFCYVCGSFNDTDVSLWKGRDAAPTGAQTTEDEVRTVVTAYVVKAHIIRSSEPRP